MKNTKKEEINKLIAKRILSDVFDDIKSCFYHAYEIITTPSDRNWSKFVILVVIILAILIFKSNDQATFFINLIKYSIICTIIYLIYCISNYYWFLETRSYAYKNTLKNKIFMKKALSLMKKDNNLENITNYENVIINISSYATIGYTLHAYRYILELFFLFLIMLFIDFYFFIFCFILVFGVYLYVSKYEKGAYNQALSDIGILIYCIKKLNLENPNKCKRFIMENKHQEVKDLKNLYKFSSE
jgi:hypothetical protein